LVLSIDGLQPEQGHETLYVVRELNAKPDLVCRGVALQQCRRGAPSGEQARHGPHSWVCRSTCGCRTNKTRSSPGSRPSFPGSRIGIASIIFLRDVAKPMLETDRHAKVKMRSKVRGLRAIEREILPQRQLIVAEAPAVAPVPVPPVPHHQRTRWPKDVPVAPEPPTDAGEVVLDYCSAVRVFSMTIRGGRYNRPAYAWRRPWETSVASLQRNLDAHRGGRAHTQLQRLAGCIDRGVAEVQAAHHVVRQQRQEIERVAATLTCANGSATERQAQFTRLQEEFAGLDTPFYHHVAGVMASFAAGLFVGGDTLPFLQDNLDLERWFRKPKGHERRIHGHRHAGCASCRKAPRSCWPWTLNVTHPEPFIAHDLARYQGRVGPCLSGRGYPSTQGHAHRPFKKKRVLLLTTLERRYLNAF